MAARADNLDAPFAQPQWLVHIVGTETMSGYIPDDQYRLIGSAPQNGIWIFTDDAGTNYTTHVEPLGGPFYYAREVCTAAQELPNQIYTPADGTPGFNCAAAAPPVDATATYGAETPTAMPASAPPETNDGLAARFSEWWQTSDNGQKFAVLLVLLGIGAAAHVTIQRLFGNTMTVKGKMSTFGGPYDGGVDVDEGLALMQGRDIDLYPGLFLDEQPEGTTGLARRLNPDAYYIACRWNYDQTPLEHLRNIKVTVTNPANGQSIEVQPVDWGPHDDTGRVIDLSPRAAADLGLQTDDECTATVPLPRPK